MALKHGLGAVYDARRFAGLDAVLFICSKDFSSSEEEVSARMKN